MSSHFLLASEPCYDHVVRKDHGSGSDVTRRMDGRDIVTTGNDVPTMCGNGTMMADHHLVTLPRCIDVRASLHTMLRGYATLSPSIDGSMSFRSAIVPCAYAIRYAPVGMARSKRRYAINDSDWMA